MAHQRTADRRHWDDRPASATVSRLIAVGFTVAAIAGLFAGLGWMAWALIRRTAGG